MKGGLSPTLIHNKLIYSTMSRNFALMIGWYVGYGLVFTVLAVHFIGARMRALNMDPINGNQRFERLVL